MHVDHKKNPERIVHARGSAAHGALKLYSSVAKYIKAGFLKDTERETSVFAWFSTVLGLRGFLDLIRNVQGFL